MKKLFPFLFVSTFAIAVIGGIASAAEQFDRPAPPFSLDLLQPLQPALAAKKLFNPKNPYNVFVNYELGMHCVGFDISYCCIIPPYNSVQAQAVQSGTNNARPVLLSPGHDIQLYYGIRDNTYSEGNKMKFWQVSKDVSGKGTMNEPDDNMPNYVWGHLFIFKDLHGTLPDSPEAARRLHIGKEIPVNIDSGPSGKPVSGGFMDYAGEEGGNIVFTDSLLPELKNVALTLTSSYLWDALGLPLTAFNDSRRKGSIRTVNDFDFQPYQYAAVRMRDGKGQPVMVNGKAVEFFGAEPIDIANCQTCHAGQGVAANLARGGGLHRFDKEYDYWKTRYPDAGDYYARLASASILILELHDQRHKTNFLKYYNPDAASNRLGPVGPVNCADCHGDNVSGNLQIPRPGTTGYPGIRAKPLTAALHSAHARFAPMPDGGGRTQSCQACHPTHWQVPEMNGITNPFQITDNVGNPRFSNRDVRTSGGGCYLRRDAHTNPDVSPPFFLNEIGRWYLHEVSGKDEKGNRVEKLRGLYCTHCHNHFSHELYRQDDLRDAVSQEGKTLRNKPIDQIILSISGGDAKKFRAFFADPIVGAPGEPLYAYYAGPKQTPVARAVKEKDGKLRLLPWNSKQGKEVTYSSVSGGSDWWLSPGEPHCADCHAAPFVESQGGKYFPLDQPNKYALYRYSKAHGVLVCQTCHQSMHGLYPVRYEGPRETVDLTTHQQALQFSPDGKYAGPVTCAACHTVNRSGIPTLLQETAYFNDYWASVVLIHFMRQGDQKLPIPELLKKYPYSKAKDIFMNAQ